MFDPIAEAREPSLLATGAFVAAVVLLAFALSQCGCAGALGGAGNAEQGACSEAARVAIEADYVADVLDACDGKTFDACGVDRMKAEARYEKRIGAWVQCK